MRELSGSIDVEEPAWPELRETLDASPVSVEVLPADGDLGKASILQLQVTAGASATRSRGTHVHAAGTGTVWPVHR
ncbi:DUF2625 family protein [Streptomyces brasiliensis]|uniref:Uncharacterized protein n=1 Tax=Streptomyces brasiliensis TaxID=1954 RepID=A0A917L9M3_9ACTN|nr:DUF2625 family protein [Streptomyces brasiliensis]GGJ52005.1 hypothetical protein GCM10010121_073640 [Streptomyces brasiliensis]